MTPNDRIVEAVATAIENEIDKVELVSAAPHVICALRANRIARAAITAYQAEAWQGEETEFEVWQDGMPVAGSSGPRERALAEAMHYAQVYGQDGPVSVCEVVRLSIGFPNPPASP